MLIPKMYAGREQSYLKHQLLRGYLERLIMIVGHRRARQISFVDCFAGPWPDDGSTLDSTSIGVSLEIMQQCRIAYAQRGFRVPSFRALFIEKDAERCERLRQLLCGTPREVEADILHGEFPSVSDDILSWCGQDDFTFFFVDPTGWKDVSQSKLRPLLERPNSELLINFMYDFVNRAVPQERFTDVMYDLFGKDVGNLRGTTGPYREFTLLQMYMQRLLEVVPKDRSRTYAASVRVMDPQKNRTKYHLIYITHHPKGIMEFMEQSEEMDIIQPRVRAQAQYQRTNQQNGVVQGAFALEGVERAPSDPFAVRDLKSYWLEKLSTEPRLFGLEELVELLAETGCYISPLQGALGALIAEGKVKNLDAKGKRRTNHVDFDKGEHLVLIRSS